MESITIELLREVMRREFSDATEAIHARIATLETTCAELLLEIAGLKAANTTAEPDPEPEAVEAAEEGLEDAAEGDVSEPALEDEIEAAGEPEPVAEEAAEIIESIEDAIEEDEIQPERSHFLHRRLFARSRE